MKLSRLASGWAFVVWINGVMGKRLLHEPLHEVYFLFIRLKKPQKCIQIRHGMGRAARDV